MNDNDENDTDLWYDNTDDDFYDTSKRWKELNYRKNKLKSLEADTSSKPSDQCRV